MKPRIVTATLILGLFALMAWWLWPHPPVQPETPVAKGQPTITPAAPLDSSGKSVASIPSAEELAKTPEEKREQYVLKAIEYGRSVNRPGNFYGQILDQNDKPVTGVKVTFEVSYFGIVVLPGLMPHNKQLERTSDNAGRFSMQNETGLAMDVKLPVIEGHEFKPTALQVMLRDEGVGKPAPTLSTPEKPYVFRAFKRGKSEPLIKGAITFYNCIPDGRSYILNLKDRRIIEGANGGDLRISVQRPAGTMRKDDYDWSVQIEGVNTDLIESHDEFMYQAPADGYVPSWNFAQQTGVEHYTRDVSPKFYLKSRDGLTYGRIEMQIISDYRNASGLIINYWLNPTGSRNLE